MKKILLAEDDRFFQDLLKMKFQQKGYEIIVTADGEQALDKFISEKPDAVILDAMMPRMDGFSLCKAIRNTNIGKYVVVIIISGVYDKLEYRFDAKKVGADDFINKPFDVNEFMVYIEKLISDAEQKTIDMLQQKQVQKILEKPQKYSVEKKVVVYYPDGHVVKGTTLALNPGGKGFNMTVWGEENRRVYISYDNTIRVDVVDEF
jgi:DNA-binding response OmpR family regulator